MLHSSCICQSKFKLLNKRVLYDVGNVTNIWHQSISCEACSTQNFFDGRDYHIMNSDNNIFVTHQLMNLVIDLKYSTHAVNHENNAVGISNWLHRYFQFLAYV